MRNLLWRGVAIALAGCISWLLWHWPAPVESVEFDLVDCSEQPTETGFIHAQCIEQFAAKMRPAREGTNASTRVPQCTSLPLPINQRCVHKGVYIKGPNDILDTPEEQAAFADLVMRIEKTNRCIAGQRFRRVGNEWLQVGPC